MGTAIRHDAVGRQLMNLSFDAAGSRGGTPWLELWADFEIRWGQKCGMARAGPRGAVIVKDALKDYQHKVRACVAEALALEDRQLFATVSRPKALLAHLGFETVTASIGGSVVWDEAERYSIAGALLALRRTGGAGRMKELRDGALMLPSARLLLDGAVPWREVGSATPPPSDEHCYAFWCAAGCETVLHCSGKPRRVDNGWPRAWCPSCAAMLRVGNATCCRCRQRVASCSCEGVGRGAIQRTLNSMFGRAAILAHGP